MTRIFEAALQLFREQGFDQVTMRAIARHADVATGAAYYYFDSKEAIVMSFYQSSYESMQPQLEDALHRSRRLEAVLRELIQVKLLQFGPNRAVLRALLRNGADPSCTVSPFSAETRQIRETDIKWFRRALAQSRVRLPPDLSERVPAVLWFLQMGVILFWVTDDSPQQQRTEKLLPLACKLAATLVRLASVPVLRVLRKPVVEVLKLVMEE